MRKLLRFSLVALLAVCASTSFASTLFDFDNNYATLFPTLGLSSNDATDGDITSAVTCTLDDISVTISPKTENATLENRLWNGTGKLRMYSGTLTVTAPAGKNITNIAISQKKWNDGNTSDTGTLSKTSWTGSANSVVITIAGNTQFKSIEVTLDDTSGGSTSTGIANSEATAYSVAKAHELIAAGENLTDSVYVKGIITSVTSFNSNYSSITYYIGDSQDDSNPLQIYSGLYYNKSKFNAQSDLQVGDEVIVKGCLKSYNGADEMNYNNYVVSHKRDGVDVTPSTPTVDITNTPGTAYTVAEAIKLIDAGEGLGTEVYVKGYIVGTPSINTSYGNAEYQISDTKGDETTTITVYRGYYLENAKFTAEDQIQAGDEVIVYGTLTYYTAKSLYEVNQGNYIYSLNGNTTGISTVSAAIDGNDAPAFNLAGQRVGAGYKGVVVKNGRKHIAK